MRPLYLILILLTAIGCGKKNSGTSASTDVNSEYQCEWNESQTHQLCTAQLTNKKGVSGLSFYILDKSGEKVFEKVIDSGYTNWYSDQAIEYYQNPGMPSTEISKNDLIMIYDIESGLTKSKTDYLKSE